MMAECGAAVDHSKLYRWVQRYAPEMQKPTLWYQNQMSSSWRMDETYFRVKGQRKYLLRAIDKDSETLDFYLSDSRNTRAAKRFLSKALKRSKDAVRLKINT